MIKLQKLEAKLVAEDVENWVVGHVESLLFSLGRELGPQNSPSSVKHAVCELVIYAQRGGRIEGGVTGTVQTVVEALYTAGHPDVYASVQGDWQQLTAEPQHPIDCVIRAAMAREIVEAGVLAVPLGWLAPLGGVTVQTLRSYAARGELQAIDSEVEPAEARRWLSTRDRTFTNE